MRHRIPTTISDLGQGERLLLRTVRAFALEIRCGGFRSQFEEACGWGGPEAFHALGVFVAQLGLKGRRLLVTALPGEARITSDETVILTAFAAAQAEAYRQLEAELRRLLDDDPPRSLAAAACLTAETLRLNGLMLPLREVQAYDWAGAPRRSAASPSAA